MLLGIYFCQLLISLKHHLVKKEGAVDTPVLYEEHLEKALPNFWSLVFFENLLHHAEEEGTVEYLRDELEVAQAAYVTLAVLGHCLEVAHEAGGDLLPLRLKIEFAIPLVHKAPYLIRRSMRCEGGERTRFSCHMLDKSFYRFDAMWLNHSAERLTNSTLAHNIHKGLFLDLVNLNVLEHLKNLV